ncbi:MAG: ABC transporter ATP-binding protein [Thermodesulfobacteriota bacterium]
MDKQNQNWIIEASGLTRIHQRGATEVVGLIGIDLRIAPAEMIVLKGNSGSGKSTLLALLGGLDKPTSGLLQVAGVDLAAVPTEQLTAYRRHVVGMIFQAFNLMPTLTVLENVCLPALLAGAGQAEIRSRAEELLNWLEMGKRLDHFPAQLSGGEMQRTAIARALINHPAIILADEPTGNLDSRNGEAVIRLLVDMNREMKRTLVIATHSEIADPFADRQFCLKDGRIYKGSCEP